MQIDEELFVPDDFVAPPVAVDGFKCGEIVMGEVEAGPLDVFIARDPADGGFLAEGAAMHTFDDPFKDARMFSR